MTPSLVDTAHAQAIVLLARSAIASVPLQEMARLAGRLATSTDASHVMFAFMEQGEPSLREVVDRLRGQGYRSLVIVPLLLPMEPNFVVTLERVLLRWKSEAHGPWPAIHVGHRGPADTEAMAPMLSELVESARQIAPLQASATDPPSGSIVHPIARQVMVCGGAPCQSAGSAVVWAHLRNELKRLNITVASCGVRTARATCLGPCSLAPVVQVFPDAMYYGGVDERGIDRIIAEHIVNGDVVQELAYFPSQGKQRLRPISHVG